MLADDRTWLTLVVDSNWLEDPARVYPIRIDPTITAAVDAGSGQDTWIDPSRPST